MSFSLPGAPDVSTTKALQVFGISMMLRGRLSCNGANCWQLVQEIFGERVVLWVTLSSASPPAASASTTDLIQGEEVSRKYVHAPAISPSFKSDMIPLQEPCYQAQSWNQMHHCCVTCVACRFEMLLPWTIAVPALWKHSARIRPSTLCSFAC